MGGMVVCPGEDHLIRHSGSSRELGRTLTAGDELQQNVIDIAGVVIGSGLLGHHGDIAARTRVSVEHHGVVGVGGGRGDDGVHGHEGGLVRRVAHHTHDQIERIRGGVVTGIESDLQRVDWEGVDIDFRQDGNLVVVSAGGGVVVETYGVVSGSGVCRTGIDNRVAGIVTGGGGDITPAVRQVVYGQ